MSLSPYSVLREGQRHRQARPLLVSLLLLSLMAEPLLACRYNVRDIGFVDLETEPYRLYAFLRPQTPADAVSLLQQMPAAALRECNVEFAVVSAKDYTNHPGLKHLAREIEAPSSEAVLVSPDGQTLPLMLSRPGRPFRESLASVLEEVAFSPKREELVATVSRSFAAVLLIEGETAEANQRARQAIDSALNAIRTQMRSMPKAIAESPAKVVLKAADLAPERILLWSLGLETARTAEPRAVVIYGRARWLGPLMRGDEISEPNLTGLLSIIGADCECGLDVTWTLGTRLPVRWGEARHAQVTKALGFDPESPLVKVEVGRIATRARSVEPAPARDQAVVLSSDPRPIAGNTLSGGNRNAPLGSTQLGNSMATTTPLVPSTPVLKPALVFIACMFFVVSSVGVFLLWNGSSRRRN